MVVGVLAAQDSRPTRAAHRIRHEGILEGRALLHQGPQVGHLLQHGRGEVTGGQVVGGDYDDVRGFRIASRVCALGAALDARPFCFGAIRSRLVGGRADGSVATGEQCKRRDQHEGCTEDLLREGAYCGVGHHASVPR